MMLSDRTRRLAVPLIAFTIGLAVLATAAVLTLTPSREQGVAAVGGPPAPGVPPRRPPGPSVTLRTGRVGLATAAVLALTPSREQGGAAVGGPFALVDHNGRTVTERDFAGKPFLVFFGFTRCPDVCPTTLFQISEILA